MTKQGGSTAEMESLKLLFDFLKHLTTLSSGSVLVIAALVEEVYPNGKSQWAISAALMLFMVCLLGSLMGMAYLAILAKAQQEISKRESVFGGLAIAVGASAFLAAILFLCIYIGVNSLGLNL